MSDVDSSVYDDFLRFKCLKGMADRGLPQTPEYLERVEYELGIIREMKYAAYFLICADLCRFMREKQILCNVRGSGCGSVVVWAIGITHKWLDPIALKLPFERFLNPSRVSNPDLDMDIADDRRHEVVEYTIEKYGQDRVARIITFGTLGAKMAVQDVARALKDELPGDYQKIGNTISGAITTGQELEEALAESEYLRDQRNMYPQLFDFVGRLEGRPRHASIHAAGVVITPGPINEYLPCYYAKTPESRKPEDWAPTTQWDMYDVESRGLLKMDYLGLKTLRVIDQSVGIINHICEHEAAAKGEAFVPLDPYLEDIPKDCARTWAMIGQGHLSGIFQVERHFVRNFARRMNLQNTRDLMQLPVLISIIRPGMMDAKVGPNGESATEMYLQRTEGHAMVEPLHELTADVLSDTYQMMVFQEDTMGVSQAMAGMSMAEADNLRRGIGKKKVEVVAKMKPVFINGAIERGATPTEAEQVWSQMETFARYGFCRGHAAAYGYVTAYQTAWLKANWPLPFMTCLINSEAGGTSKEQGYNYKVAEYIEEARRLRLHVYGPCVQNSGYQCMLYPGANRFQGGIRFGLSLIKGVSQRAAEWILTAETSPRTQPTFPEFLLACYEHEEGETKKTRTRKGEKFVEMVKEWKPYARVRRNELEAMIHAGAFDCYDTDRDRLLASLPDLLTLVGEWHKRTCKIKSGMGKRMKEELRPENLIQVIRDYYLDDAEFERRTLEQILDEERRVTGCFLSESPFTPFVDRLELLGDMAHASEVAEGEWGRECTMPAILKGLKTVTCKTGKNQGREMAFLKWSGTGADVESTTFCNEWEGTDARHGIRDNPEYELEVGKVYLVRLRRDRDGRSAICTGLERLSYQGAAA